MKLSQLVMSEWTFREFLRVFISLVTNRHWWQNSQEMCHMTTKEGNPGHWSHAIAISVVDFQGRGCKIGIVEIFGKKWRGSKENLNVFEKPGIFQFLRLKCIWKQFSPLMEKFLIVKKGQIFVGSVSIHFKRNQNFLWSCKNLPYFVSRAWNSTNQ